MIRTFLNLFWILVCVSLVEGCATTKASRVDAAESEVESKMAISKAPAFDLGLRGVQFGYRSTELTKEAKGILKENAKVLLAQSRALVQLDGHCDQRGQRDFNFKLGDRRARVVLEFLVAQGIERDRLLALSYGFERPLDRAMSEEAFRRNRRVEFVVVSK